MVHKRCTETGCTRAPRCNHSWYIKVVKGPVIEKGPVKKYAFLLDDGQSVPRTKDEAEALERLVYTWVSKGRPAPVFTSSGDITVFKAVEDYNTRYAKKELKGKGWPSVLRRIKKDYAKQPLQYLYSIDVVRDFRDTIAEDSSTSNANFYLGRLSHMLNWCRGEYRLKLDSPFHHATLNPNGVKKYPEGDGRCRRIDAAEEKALLAAIADDVMMTGRFYAALDCCLRRGEMLKLRKDDILWKDEALTGTLYLRLSWETTKGRKTRKVPVQTQRLRKFLDTRRFAEYPFGTLEGDKTVEDFNKEWARALVAAGIEKRHYEARSPGNNVWVRDVDSDLHWHDLRHEGATRLYEAGVGLLEIQELLGHADVQTTRIYLNLKNDQLAAAMKKAQGGL